MTEQERLQARDLVRLRHAHQGRVLAERTHAAGHIANAAAIVVAIGAWAVLVFLHLRWWTWAGAVVLGLLARWWVRSWWRKQHRHIERAMSHRYASDMAPLEVDPMEIKVRIDACHAIRITDADLRAFETFVAEEADERMSRFWRPK